VLKSVKLAGAVFLLLAVFTVSQELCGHFGVSFSISFVISALISLAFLAFCKIFNITSPVFWNDSREKRDRENQVMHDTGKELSKSNRRETQQ
jgi:hypothetical protein